MKHVFKTAFASIIVASALLTACGKSGGGTTASTPTSGVTGACTYDASGNCTLQIGPAGYVGDGQWSSTNLQITNLGLLQQLAADNGNCAMNTNTNNYGGGYANGQNFNGLNCASIIAQIQLTVRLANGGCLPGMSQFNLGFLSSNNQIRPIRANAQAYQNTASNGFFLNYTSGTGNGYNNGQNFGVTNANFTNTNVSANSMQINLQWTDNTHSIMNVQMYYHGQQIANGQMQGSSNVNQSMLNNNGTNYCASNNNRGNFNNGLGNGYNNQFNNQFNNNGLGNGFGNGGYSSGFGSGFGYTSAPAYPVQYGETEVIVPAPRPHRPRCQFGLSF